MHDLKLKKLIVYTKEGMQCLFVGSGCNWIGKGREITKHEGIIFSRDDNFFVRET